MKPGRTPHLEQDADVVELTPPLVDLACFDLLPPRPHQRVEEQWDADGDYNTGQPVVWEVT